MAEKSHSMLGWFAFGVFLLGVAASTPEWGFALNMSEWADTTQDVAQFSLILMAVASFIRGLI